MGKDPGWQIILSRASAADSLESSDHRISLSLGKYNYTTIVRYGADKRRIIDLFEGVVFDCDTEYSLLYVDRLMLLPRPTVPTGYETREYWGYKKIIMGKTIYLACEQYVLCYYTGEIEGSKIIAYGEPITVGERSFPYCLASLIAATG